MRATIGICLFCIWTIAASAQECFVYPGSLTVPATFGCNGTWSELHAPIVPTGQRAYVPPAGHYVSFVLSETNKYDIPANQSNVTLIISAPQGWEFRSNTANPAYVYLDNSGDINLPMSSALVVTTTAIMLTFSSNTNTNKSDDIYFCNIEARPTTGVISAGGSTRHMLRLSTNPGTGVLNGIVENSTSFGSLTITPGDFGNGGYLAFMSPIEDRTACEDFEPVLKTVDCAGNPTTVGLPASLPVTFTSDPAPGNGFVDTLIDVGAGFANGIAFLQGRHIREIGVYLLEGAASGYVTAVTNAFTINACGPDHLTWTRQPAGDYYMWQPLAIQPILQLRDVWENPVYIPGATVTLTLDPAETLNPYDPASYATGLLTVTLDLDAYAVYSGLRVYSQSLGYFRFDATTSAVAGSWKSNQFFFEAPLPVELVAFSAQRRNDAVYLSWRTATESNSLGFEVQRIANTAMDWTAIGNVAAAGTSNSPRSYTFVEMLPYSLRALDLRYRLRQIDRDGSAHYSPIVTVAAKPTAGTTVDVTPTVLRGNATVRVLLVSDATVTLTIYDTNGRLVAVLLNNAALTAGSHLFPLDRAAMTPGMYFIEAMTSSGSAQSRFMVH